MVLNPTVKFQSAHQNAIVQHARSEVMLDVRTGDHLTHQRKMRPLDRRLLCERLLAPADWRLDDLSPEVERQ